MTGGDLLAGRYALGELLGSGGMAEVRDGWDRRLNRPVAVKLLHPSFLERSDLRRRFADEARAAAALSHPNIVAVHDFGEQNGVPFIVMERLSGETLGDLMARGPMDPLRVRTVMDQILGALHTAHTAGVVHRDIKPANILLAPEGVKVADFGIAKTGASTPTMTGQVVGTMSYMSPERILGAPASAADDLYAVGLVGYEAVLGRPVYPHDNPAALAHAITNAPLPPVSSYRPDVDPITSGAIDRAVARDPARRFVSAAQMRAALHGHVRPVTKVLHQPMPASAMPVKHSRAGTYVIAAGILIGFVVAAVALAMDPFSSPPPPQPISTSTSVAPPAPATSTTTATPVTPVTQAPEPPKKKPKGEGRPGRGNGGDDDDGRPD